MMFDLSTLLIGLFMDLSGIHTRRAWQIILLVSLAAVAFLMWVIYIKPPASEGQEVLTFLPLLNCILNASSATCLVLGLAAIKRGRAEMHMRWMIAAFVCSAVFLVSYLLHHHLHGDTRFPPENPIRPLYLIILITHIGLSVIALPMIFMTFFLSLSGRLEAHRRLARFTFPIWLYVSVSGVLIFVFLKAASA